MNGKFPRISVITPSLNSSRYLDDAIQSVLAQGYPDFEHIVMDGGSADGTVEILRKYPHLTWISEPDQGQADAMNKGFKMSTGRIIVYLNADDYFEPDAFSSVIPFFQGGTAFVVGKIRVIGDDGSSYINDGKATFLEMLRWWEPDAFCYNPVGYFYSREIQEQVGFNVNNHLTMDVEFLLDVSLKYKMAKVARILGNFRNFPGTKTYGTSSVQAEAEKLRYLDRYLARCSADYVRDYLEKRKQYIMRAAAAG